MWRSVSLLFVFITQIKSVMAAPTAVLYPDVREPYLSIFEQIRSGVKESSQSQVQGVALGSDTDVPSLIKKLKSDDVSRIVLLGSRGYGIASELTAQFSLVVGAYPSTPGTFGGVSMMTAPAQVIKKLNLVAPNVKNVYLIVSEQNRWIAELLEQISKTAKFKPHIHVVNNLKESVQTYHKISVQGQLGPEDAIWLPIDTVAMHEKVILPMVLKASWEKKFVLFSSIPTHAKRGALFSFYPDNYELGKQLGNMLHNNDKNIPLLPMSHILLAVNLRTAKHLGITYTSQEKEQFNIILPER
ncbi:ABC transporter substrate binding protein [Catenovulum sediminis]|uniref:ABC transporter substrate binding protein n=1 Tax=Catenovulum sediminis TaxID=1740262 RepID=A0ABV1RG08_9ALTE